MLLSKLTPGIAKPLTRPEEVLLMGPHSAWFCTQSALQAELGVYWMGLLPGCLTHHQWWVAVPRHGLTAWYIRRET
jgi:hypothetical protein